MKIYFSILCCFVFSIPIFIHAQGGPDRMEHTPQKLSAENQLLKNYTDSIKKYDWLGKRKEALAYFKIYNRAKDSILNLENLKVRLELNTRFETQKKESDIKLLLKNKLIKDKEIAKQKVILNIVLFGILIVLLLSLLLFSRYRLIRKLNIQLDLQNDLLLRKNIQITDSIDYAQRIQQSILPPEGYLKKYLPDAFILFKPKDIVSGDIYWFREKNNMLWLSTIDCTGHGVPGAMMSIVAYDLLHQSIRINKLEQPEEILRGVNKGVQLFSSLAEKNNAFYDGMDISMCRIELETLTLKYSGAQNNIYIVRDNKLTELIADEVSIGQPEYFDFNFTAHTYQLMHGDTLYLFTDGFANQKGYNDTKSFSVAAFKQLLVKNYRLSGVEQRKNIEQAFTEWKGENDQDDDILIIGILI